MDTWLWATLVCVGGLALCALAWWSSGRSKALDGEPGNPLTSSQTLRLDATKYGAHADKGHRHH